MRKKWTKSEDAILIKKYPTTDFTILSEMFNCSKSALVIRAHRLGVKKRERKPIKYTAEMIEKVKQLYSTTVNRDLAEMIGVTESSIAAKAFSLGLKKTSEFMYMHSMKTAYKKGCVPMNKGIKMTKDTYERLAPTMFKKNNKPINELEDGAISVRKHKNKKSYKFIRIGKMNWIPLQKYLWEKKHGPIPAGHCLWFIDGDQMNCELSNLELITRAENLKRNQKLTDKLVAFFIAGRNNRDLIPEILKNKKLIEIKRQQLILNKTINENSRSPKKA